MNKQRILAFLKAKGSQKAMEIAEYIGLSPARTRVLLSELIDDGKVKIDGNGRSRCYALPDHDHL